MHLLTNTGRITSLHSLGDNVGLLDSSLQCLKPGHTPPPITNKQTNRPRKEKRGEGKRREEARQSLSHGTNISVCKEDMTVTARSYKKCTAHMCTQNPQRTSSQRTEGVQNKGMETKRGPGEAAECPADFNSLSAAHWTSTVSVPPGTASVLPGTASVEAPRVGQHPVGRTLMFTGALKSLHVTTIHEEEFRVVADIRALKKYIALRLTQQSHCKLETLSE